jgi:Transposase IS66 family
MVVRIDELFATDGEARRKALSLEPRHALRQEQSRPLLGVIRKQIEAARSMALPGGALAKACNYGLPHGQSSRASWKIPNWSGAMSDAVGGLNPSTV